MALLYRVAVVRLGRVLEHLAGPTLSWYHDVMSRSTRDAMTSRPGKRPSAPGEPITVRLQPDLLSQVDTWIKSQTPAPSRPEAIPRLIERGLVAAHTDVQVESRAAVLKRALSSEPEAAKPRRRAKQKSQ